MLGVRTFDYDTYCALAFNVGRVQCRRGWNVADGIAITESDEDLDWAWFDSLSSSDEEANEREFEENSTRGNRRAMKRMRRVFHG